MEKNEINISLQIESKSWIKDTEDLFDFEAKDIKSKTFTLTNDNKESFLVVTCKENQEEEIELINSNKLLQEKILSDKKTKIISEIIFNKQNSTFNFINSLNSENLNKIYSKENCERIWKNISKSEETEIQEGDIFKLGRVRLKFDKIIYNSNTLRNNTGINNYNSNKKLNNIINKNNISNILNIKI